MAEFAAFPREEFEVRYAHLRAQMHRHGVGGILATSEPNYRYLTGHHNQRWAVIQRPKAALLPLTAEPAILTIASEGWGLDTLTWVTDIRTIGGPRVEDGYGSYLVALIVDTVKEKGIRSGKIAIERGWQMRCGLSIDDFRQLEKQIAPIELVDAAPILWDARMRKSPAEVECLRRAAQITSAAYRDLRQEFKLGMSEGEIERRTCALLMQHGAERPTYVPVNCHGLRWPKTNFTFFGCSTEQKLEQDALIDMDCGCTYKGYYSDFSRTFAIGAPPEKARTAYRTLQDAIDVAIATIRPGIPITDVCRAMMKVCAKAGAEETWQDMGQVQGHGLGLNGTERPYVTLTDPTILTPGIMFTIEPMVIVEEYGMVVAEEEIVVTEAGCEVLSERAPSELPIIG